MTIEFASWIAGIIAAIAAIGSLYFAWRQHQRHVPRQPEAAAEVIKPPQAEPHTAKTAPAAEPEANVPFPDDAPEALAISFDAAKGMWNKPNRDQALIAVARQGLQLQRIDCAISAASHMWNKPAKDDVLTEIVTFAVNRNEFRLARHASDLFFNMPKKDRAKRLIVDRAQNERA